MCFKKGLNFCYLKLSGLPSDNFYIFTFNSPIENYIQFKTTKTRSAISKGIEKYKNLKQSVLMHGKLNRVSALLKMNEVK